MSPDDPGSVTRWINDLKGGELDAAQPLWERYFADLVRLGRGRLRASPRTAADEEDVALSAFDSFCTGVAPAASPGSTIATISGGSWSPSLTARPPTKPCASGARSAAAAGSAARRNSPGEGPRGMRISSDRSRAPSRPPSSPPWWPRSAAGSSRPSATKRFARSPWVGWKATPTKRSPRDWAAPCGPCRTSSP